MPSSDSSHWVLSAIDRYRRMSFPFASYSNYLHKTGKASFFGNYCYTTDKLLCTHQRAEELLLVARLSIGADSCIFSVISDLIIHLYFLSVLNTEVDLFQNTLWHALV